MVACRGKHWGIWPFQLIPESVLLDSFYAKKFIFGGFVEFHFFIFTKWPILLKNGCGGAFQFYVQILT